MDDCVMQMLGICFVQPSVSAGDLSIFRFADFVTALAMLVVIYTVGDVRYRFRIAVAPTALYTETFVLIGVIGFGTLMTDLWVRQGWLIPYSYLTEPIWRAALGAMFLSLALTWMYYAFIRPPKFGRSNAARYARALYRVVIKGSSQELPIIADEIGLSADALVRLSTMDLPSETSPADQKKRKSKRKATVAGWAHDILLLLGNRKLCRAIVDTSPGAAILIFEAVSKHRRFRVPIGQFSRNVSTEAILNKDSLLYHEDEGYKSGLIGYLKPLSQAIYGNYELVEALEMGSPLDIRLDLQFSWDAAQLEAYCRGVLTTFKSYLALGHWGQHSFTLFRAIGDLEHACSDLYKLDKVESDYYQTEPLKRLRVVVDFIQKAVDHIGKLSPVPDAQPRRPDDYGMRGDAYGKIAKLMFEMICAAASVTSPSDKCWMVHHNMVWGEFFSSGHEGKAWSAVRYRLRRILYDSIRELEKYPSYLSSRVLGFCLNVMGLKVGTKTGYGSDTYPLRKAVLNWARKHYLSLREAQPDVADSVLIGSITFDAAQNRLVKTYIRGFDREPPRDYLELGPPPA